MGLFDFLHGKTYESEAEAYMKKRNKEYAKRSAIYKKQEDSFSIQKNSKLFDISMLENGFQNVFQNIGNQFEELKEISTSVSDSNLSDIEKQEQ